MHAPADFEIRPPIFRPPMGAGVVPPPPVRLPTDLAPPPVKFPPMDLAPPPVKYPPMAVEQVIAGAATT